MADIPLFVSLLGGDKPIGGDYKTVELPRARRLAGMPRANSTKARPATSEPSIAIKVKALTVPD